MTRWMLRMGWLVGLWGCSVGPQGPQYVAQDPGWQPKPTVEEDMRLGEVKLAYVMGPMGGPGPGVDCDYALENGRLFLAELRRAELDQKNHAETRCKGTLGRRIDRITGYEGPPRAAWVCGGKIVDAPITRRYLSALSRYQDWKAFMRKHCSDVL